MWISSGPRPQHWHILHHQLINQTRFDCQVNEMQFGLSHSTGDLWWLLAIIDCCVWRWLFTCRYLPHPKHPHLLHLFNWIGCCILAHPHCSLSIAFVFIRASVNSTQPTPPQMPPCNPYRTIKVLHSTLSNLTSLEPSLIVLIWTSLHSSSKRL
jgi:hypothetical protein